MAIYDLIHEPHDLQAPALIVSFSDWVDAGSAGTTAAAHIGLGGEVVARFDPDALFDYRSHRPTLDIVEGTPKQFVMPSMTLTHRRYDARDLFVLTGSEPDYRWNEFGASVQKLALKLGIVQHVSLGAIPSAIPHTAPTPVMMTASSEELLQLADVRPPGLLRVPAAAVSLVEWTLAESGIPAVGFWAQVPHYATPYAAGAIALVRRVETHLSVTIGAGALEEEAGDQRRRLDELFAANPEAGTYLEQLETLVGEQQVPPAENIAAEVERFLRTQTRGGEGPPPNPFDPGPSTS